jgi:hypothetical protein
MKRSRTVPVSATSITADPAPAESPETAGDSQPILIFDSPYGPDVWLAAARAAVLDLLAAAREGARRPRNRTLSRAEIRRQAREAFEGATTLLDEAAAALSKAAPHVPKR